MALEEAVHEMDGERLQLGDELPEKLTEEDALVEAVTEENDRLGDAEEVKLPVALMVPEELLEGLPLHETDRLNDREADVIVGVREPD